MTGFGKAEATYKNKKICITVRSLNSKSLDISTRISTDYRDHDLEIRNLIAEKLLRGKVDFSLVTEETSTITVTPINPDAVKNYIQQINDISTQCNIMPPKDWWSILTHFNITPSSSEPDIADDEEWSVVKTAIVQAIDALVNFRQQEGAALLAKFREKIGNIGRLLFEVEPFEKIRVAKIRERIVAELAQLKDVEIDKGRLEQEMIYYIEKLDVNEEKQRLTNHLKYFGETLDGQYGQGKKLGFISQEMGREINTLGSKSNLAEMQNIVVMMKDELEQIKEQVLNVL